ncbi:MAG: Dna2/Cas4 domain-containing protein [Gemmatimonadota bacterium]|nr:Dna2/Cas4 domain-containing protein [Gemmatimonadota bacterium]
MSTTIAAMVALLVAALLAVIALRLSRRSGLSGIVVASDGPVARRSRVLRSARAGISGRPDYLIEEHDHIVPVELKPSRQSATPWLRDVVQLAAYCLLLEETEPRFGGYGYLRYADRTFRIDFTDSLKAELLTTVAALRADLSATDVEANHADPRRCARCALREPCGRAVGASRW